jgi:hypothetical protein
MQQLDLNQATPALRKIPLELRSDVNEKTPMLSQTIAAAELRVSKNGAAEANRAGSITEIDGGLYDYEATQAELDTEGYLTLRLEKANVWNKTVVVQVRTPAVTGFLAAVIESGLTVQGFFRLAASALFGKSADHGVFAPKYRDTNDTKNRISATADAAGNRLTVTTDDT